ncbi:Uncharacterized protein OS=Gloeobacter kilaueensis JS1 GN=GKIL_0098 PE=4 SV=1: Imm29 [Tuwongella immobilis]|uniref:Uncharacterized protein n=2 Tax=Tuwongella immobilis TaxID=692036 RepID=A0A6C2YV00_9BACT|nr:Uncharacterized protein OS=Gloeobacter kilaueensis JS1 GN=GKIL_0098 PE=4 SV=1: Imm29 [Tuwongella immobilis]VTS06849.1 Uncharacterized protein OS=Gloeobacter kilaueensis JS1 GN=GKIL_0098 PE=4 SV=1: Imm29 [Tuwongella immobilis]
MKISRHPVDMNVVEQWFTRDCKSFDSRLSNCINRIRGLTSFVSSCAQNVYLAGAVIAPDSPEVARALRIAAQALGAVFAFRLDPPPSEYPIGEGPPVCYPTPIDPGICDILLWQRAYHLSLITRQTIPLQYLCRVTKDTFKGSNLVGYDDEAYWFLELKQRAAQESGFAWEPLLLRCEAWEAKAVLTSKSIGLKMLKCLRIPYHRVLRRIGENSVSGLEAELTKAASLHKKYWATPQKRAEDLNGMVSLPLVALAALAWDRGMRFHVESDYLPWSWVTGELFNRVEVPKIVPK